MPKAELLLGERIVGIDRRGKVLAIRGDSGRALVVRLGMTGQLIFRPAGQRLPRTDHVHATWRLGPLDTGLESNGRGGSGTETNSSEGCDMRNDGGRLVFRDPRRFGGLWTCPDDAAVEANHFGRLGPDALTISTAAFAERVGRGARPVKAALLDQTTLAGVGNIYADEALFAARLGPGRLTDGLTDDELARLAAAVRAVLDAAVDAGGTTIRDYLDSAGLAGGYRDHAVYGRAGRPCVRCGAELESRVIAQRTTVACPACQGWD